MTDDEPTETMAISLAQTPEGVLTLVIDGEGVHPDQTMYYLTAHNVAVLMSESARHAAEGVAGQAAQQGAQAGVVAGMKAGAAYGYRAGVLNVGAAAIALAAATKPDDAA